jgi:hypothetical protein
MEHAAGGWRLGEESKEDRRKEISSKRDQLVILILEYVHVYVLEY